MNKVEVYPIQDVERITGIKAHTLRIWEKRYQTMVPHRTKSNIRYYDDEQVKRLLNIATLLENGYKISTLSLLSDTAIHSLITELKTEPIADGICSAYINELKKAMLDFDETSFEKTFSAALIRFGLYDAILRVIYPFLRQAGLLWSIDEILPAQEHFVSNIIRRKLMAAIDGIQYGRDNAKKFTLFLPEGEWHDMGLLFADYIIRKSGAKSVYLGQNVPYSNVQTAIKKTKPDYLLSFIVGMRDQDANNQTITEMANALTELKILIAISKDQKLSAIPANVELLYHPEDVLKYL